MAAHNTDRKDILTRKFLQVERSESGFDKACDAARKLALVLFGIDEDGHSDRIEFIRTTDCVRVDFHNLEMYGANLFVYTFEALVVRNVES